MIKNTITNENINLFLSDDNNDTDDDELNKLIQQFYNDDEDDKTDDTEDCDLNLSILIDYSENNTIKQLIRISDYYEISKEFKLAKTLSYSSLLPPKNYR